MEARKDTLGNRRCEAIPIGEAVAEVVENLAGQFSNIGAVTAFVGDARNEGRTITAGCAAHDAEGLGVGAEHLGLHRNGLAEHEVYDFTVELVGFGRGDLAEAGSPKPLNSVTAVRPFLQSQIKVPIGAKEIKIANGGHGAGRGSAAVYRPRTDLDAQSEVTDLPVIAPAHAAPPQSALSLTKSLALTRASFAGV